MKTSGIKLMQQVQFELLSKGLGCHVGACSDTNIYLSVFYDCEIVGEATLCNTDELNEWLEHINATN